MKRFTKFTLLLTVFLAACAPGIPATSSGGSGVSTPIVMTAEVSTVVAETPGQPPTEGPSPTSVPATPIPTLPSSNLSPTELKYRVLDQFPDFFYCDPDFYPIAREDETVLAQQRFAELQANQEEIQAILGRNNLSGATTFTNEQKLLIYRDHKKLNAIFFNRVGDAYEFQIQTGAEGQQGSLIIGTINGSGSIEIQKEEASFPTCPICLPAGTLIDTPRGAVPVERLQAGDQVWTIDESGARVPGEVMKLGSMRVPSDHQIIHIVLSDRRELWASPGHPTADGRRLDNLRVHDSLDGASVVFIERLPYNGSTTYDLLPTGGTGFYWANGILLGSTLSNP